MTAPSDPARRVTPPRPPLTVLDASAPPDSDPDHNPRIDLDTAAAGPEDVAAMVASARIDGAGVVRTRHPRAARRAATVIDAILDARDPSEPRR